MPNTQMGYFVADKYDITKVFILVFSDISFLIFSASGSYFLTTHEVSPFAKGPLVEVEFDVSEFRKLTELALC